MLDQLPTLGQLSTMLRRPPTTLGQLRTMLSQVPTLGQLTTVLGRLRTVLGQLPM
ncbi:hypothetical protein [Kribbella pratensis]|nr:hypothetical protein [Kribbella pratensis]